MRTEAFSVRTDSKKVKQLDRLAELQERSRMSVFKQMGQMFGLAKGVFCSSFSCYAACR